MDISKVVIDAERRVQSDDLTLHTVTCNDDSDLLLEITAECIKFAQDPNVCNLFVRVNEETVKRLADIDAKLIAGISKTYDVPEDVVRLRYLSALRTGQKLKIRVTPASKYFVGDQLSDVQHMTGQLRCRILMDHVWIMTDCSWCGGIWRLISAKAPHTAG